MKKYINKYILDKFSNKEYNHRWLRRISRVTNTQVIADVQRVLVSSHHPKYKENECQKKIFQKPAFRMNVKNGKLVQRLSRNHNKDENVKRNIEIVDNFNKQLKCKHSFDELFSNDIDIRDLFHNKNSKEIKNLTQKLEYELEFIKEHCDINNEAVKKKRINNKKCSPKLHKLNFNKKGNWSDNEIYGKLAKHLKELFGEIDIYKLRSEFDLFHEASLYHDTVIHYHITHHGGNKKIISCDDNSSNVTISFWLFDNKIVFTYSSGIDTW